MTEIKKEIKKVYDSLHEGSEDARRDFKNNSALYSSALELITDLALESLSKIIHEMESE